MKNRNLFANIDRDSVCFAVAVLILSSVAATVAWDVVKAETGESIILNREDKFRKSTEHEQCGGTCVVKLPERTNTGDTFYVYGHDVEKDVLFLKPKHGNVQRSKIKGADNVQTGDTIVVEPERKFLMKNLTQRNLERQK